MTTLYVYYSRSGATAEIIRKMAAAEGAEAIEITDGKRRAGVWGYIGAAVVGLKRSLPTICPVDPPQPWESYDRIVIGAPIWCERVCPVARAFLAQYREQLPPTLYYVITHMSALPYDRPIARLEDHAGHPAAAYLTVQTHRHDPQAEVEAFIQHTLA